MNSRERVKTVLGGKVPDAVPRALYDTAIGMYNETTLALFKEKTGKTPRECFAQDLWGLFPMTVKPAEFKAWRETAAPRIERLRSEESPTEATLNALREAYCPLPYRVEDILPGVAEIHANNRASVLTVTRSLLEGATHQRTREQFYMDLAYAGPWLDGYLDILTDAAIIEAEVLASAKPDIFLTGDDAGAQQRMIIDPEQWRRYFKPRLRRVVEAVHRVHPETAFAYHSCGCIFPIIPDLIDVGVNVLNPLQPEAMDIARVKREYGRHIVLWGGMSVQKTLPFGSPQDVAEEVRALMETLAPNGRYLLTPAHLINADIPWENIQAFFAAIDRYGAY